MKEFNEMLEDANELERLVKQSKLFRIHASQCHKIMGETGLTEKQMKELSELTERHQNPAAKPLTDIMKANMKALLDKYNNPELPATCTTFLKEWYAGDHEEFWSKETNKGNVVEIDNIDFAARVLGYGLAKKNELTWSDEFIIGTPDVDLPDAVCDVKSPWNRRTFLTNITGLEPAHEWQLRCYMKLLRKDKGILFYGLMDTPATEYDEEVIYSDLPDADRWIAYQIKRDEAIELQIITRVLECREWLAGYDREVRGKLGLIHKL